MTGQVRLLQGQTVLEDDRKLSQYSLPEGATISALFEPDVDINIEVSTGPQSHKFSVSNSTSVMALKFQIGDLMIFGVAPERLEIRLGDIVLDDPMPLHFYEIKNGSTLNIFKPYVSVTIENNQGATLFWRLSRNDTIREVKAKLATAKWKSKTRFHFYNTSTNTRKGYKSNQSEFDEIRAVDDGEISVEGMRLYLISENKGFKELDDDKITESYKIKDGDNLYVLSYRWGFNTCTVTMTTNRKKIQGVEDEDTCLAIKLRVQDQFGFPVSNIKLFQQRNKIEVREYWYIARGGIGIPDKQKPFSKSKNASYDSQHPKVPHLVAITVQELQLEGAKIEEENKARKAKLAEQIKANAEAAERRRSEEERVKKMQAEKDEQARYFVVQT